MLMTLPNILTFSRIVAVPIVVACLFLDKPYGNWIAFGFYAAACVTDFFDGYLARVLKQHSALGQFMDPVADKLLVASILFVLAGVGTFDGITILPAIIILCRELLVSGLREFLAEIRVSVPVTTLAKWKTTLQMLMLGFLLVGDVGPDFGPLSTLDIGYIGLWAAALLTLVTGYDYLRAGLRHMAEIDQAAAETAKKDKE